MKSGRDRKFGHFWQIKGTGKVEPQVNQVFKLEKKKLF